MAFVSITPLSGVSFNIYPVSKGLNDVMVIFDFLNRYIDFTFVHMC